jgi:hypothetical protein
MPSIDVQVTREGRSISVARTRPLRVTPSGYAGVVYKGRVYEVRIDAEMGYFIDAATDSWSDDLTVCRFAAHREARGLLKRLRSSNDIPLNALVKPARVERTDAEATPEVGKADRFEDGATGTSRINQILDLLMPRARTGKAG